MPPLDTVSNRPHVTPSGKPEPRDAVESELLRIWTRIIPSRQVTVLDDFFEMDGAAERLGRLFSEVEEVFGRKFSLDMLRADPTIRGMARVIREQSAMQFASPLEGIQTEGAAPPIFAIPQNASPVQVFGRLSQELGRTQPFYGLKPLPPDGRDVPSEWITTTAAYYRDEIVRVQPSGPYSLVGHGWGAFTAFEVAQQLHARGKQVRMLALLDCGPPLTRTLGFAVRAAAFKARMGWRNLRRRWRGQIPIEYAVIPRHAVHFNLVFAHKRAAAGYDKLVWDANLRGATEYVCRPYGGRITLIHSDSYATNGPTGGDSWRRVCGGNLDEHVLPGPQADALRGPAVTEVASVLQTVMAGG